MIKYQLTPESAKAFLASVEADTFAALDNGTMEEQDVFVTVGNREIRIPMFAAVLEALETFVQECLIDEYPELED
jgi:hypothetical protein